MRFDEPCTRCGALINGIDYHGAVVGDDYLCLPCLVSALEQERREKDELVRTLVDLFGWSDPSYLHTLLHVENAVNSLKADLEVERWMAKKGK